MEKDGRGREEKHACMHTSTELWGGIIWGLALLLFFTSFFLACLFSWHLEHKDTHPDLLVPMAFWLSNPKGKGKTNGLGRYNDT